MFSINFYSFEKAEKHKWAMLALLLQLLVIIIAWLASIDADTRALIAIDES